MERDQAVFLFDDVRVEPAAYKVWKAGAVVPLEPKAFEVLLFLIRERGRVVRKRELLDEIWKDAFVSENARAARNGAAPSNGVSAGGAARYTAAGEHAAQTESHAALPSHSTQAPST